jgi:aspartate carbamoyltransferase catalytic subunit
MDINAATGAVSDGETCVDTVKNVACMETDETVTDTTPDAAHSFHKAGPEVSAQQTKK